jgi:glycosyltransferase involved in cell wall biosynthesis
MKIVLIGNYVPDGQQSMLKFANMFLQLAETQPIKITLWQPPTILGRFLPSSKWRKWLGYADKYLLSLPSLAVAIHEADLVHILDHSNAVYGPLLGKKSWMVTCHDLLAVRSARGEFPDQRTGWSGRLLQKWILWALSKAPTIICDSQATLQDLNRIIPSKTKHRLVIHVGLNYKYQPREPSHWKYGLRNLFEKRDLQPPDRYLFHIGGNQWYKNRQGVLEIFQRLTQTSGQAGIRLVMAGEAPNHELIELTQTWVDPTKVIWLGKVSNDELETLYHGAECLLFPSLAEGFGWPIVEALACGSVVVTSNRPPMNEIGGDACTYIDPDQIDAAAATLADLLKNPCLRFPENVDQRLQQASLFSADQMLKSYLALYRQKLIHETVPTPFP